MIELFKDKKYYTFMLCVLSGVALGWWIHAERSSNTKMERVETVWTNDCTSLEEDEIGRRRAPVIRQQDFQLTPLPQALEVVGVRCDLSDPELLDGLFERGLIDCEKWEHVVEMDGGRVRSLPGVRLIVQPRAHGVEALTPEIITWHDNHHAMIRLDCSSPDLPSSLKHIECDAPMGDMITLMGLEHLESLSLSWSSIEEAKAGMKSVGEDYDAHIEEGRELPYQFDNFSMIKELTSLKRLWLDPSDLDGDRLAAILELDALQWLELVSTSSWGSGPAISGSAWMSQIGNLPALRTLVLDGHALADSDLVYLTDLTELRALSLDGLQRSCVPNDHLGRHLLSPGNQSNHPCRRKVGSVSFLKKLESLEHLHYLSLRDTRLEGHFIEDVRHLKTLRALSIHVDEAERMRLGWLERLEAISLTASEPSIPWVGCTMGYSQAERLEYFNQETRPLSSFMVAWRPEWLTDLHGLKVLELQHLKVSDEDARQLVTQQELRGLHLIDSSVGDAILPPDHLSTMLMALTLNGTCVTREGQQRGREMVSPRMFTTRAGEGSREVEIHALTLDGEIEVVRKERRAWFDDYCASAKRAPR